MRLLFWMLPFTEGELGSATVVSRIGYWSMLGCRIFYLHKRALLCAFPSVVRLFSQPCTISPCPQLQLSLPPISMVLYSSLGPHLPDSEPHSVHNSIYLFSPSLACSRHLHFDSIHHSAVNITEYFIRCLSLASTWRSATIKAPPGFEEMQNFTGK